MLFDVVYIVEMKVEILFMTLLMFIFIGLYLHNLCKLSHVLKKLHEQCTSIEKSLNAPNKRNAVIKCIP